MARNTLLALIFAAVGIGSANADTRVSFSLREPITVAGVPPVTLGPGTYVIRKVNSASGMNVVQVLSKGRDYVYTTVLTIPATRPHADDSRQLVFAETPSGTPPALHFWFPPGETSGHEFLTAPVSFAPPLGASLGSLKMRPDATAAAEPWANAADLYGVREVLLLIGNGKFGAARDRLRRNYFLTQNPEGATVSFLLALLMIDSKEASASLESVNRLDPVRARAMADLDVHAVVQSLPNARKNLKTSLVRHFLLNFAMDHLDDTIARTAVLSFERHTLKGDSFPVEMALDRHREDLAREKKHEEQWALANAQIAKLNDCVKSLLNQVGALEYSVSLDVGRYGSLKFRVVLNRRRLADLDVIVERSHRRICDRRSTLERLIAQRNRAVTLELNALRISLRELDRQTGSSTTSRYPHIRNWEGAAPADVSRDLMMLAEAAQSPLMRPSTIFRTDRGYVQMNIAGSLAKLAEWAAL